MICDRPNTLDLLKNSGRRIGLRLDDRLGHYDPVKEHSLRLFPNSPHRARMRPVILHRSLVWPFTPHPGLRLLNLGV